MADKIAYGVSFSGAWRALHQNSSVFFKLLGDSDLLGIGGFAQQHFSILMSRTDRRRIRISSVGNRRFFSNDIQEGPRQVFARAEVRKNAVNRGGKSQRARAQEQDRVSSNARVVHVSVRRALFKELSARGQLHDQPLQKPGGGTIDQRMETFHLQFLAATPDRASVDIIHRLEQSRVELNGMVRFRKREFGHGRVELQLEPLEEDRMVDASVRATPAQNSVS